ncbi:MAG: hypothetical protein K1X28_09870 [Parachlamydiales bacterium]|nr:hypothetical protein [Parachlamydiales bacterium]
MPSQLAPPSVGFEYTKTYIAQKPRLCVTKTEKAVVRFTTPKENLFQSEIDDCQALVQKMADYHATLARNLWDPSRTEKLAVLILAKESFTEQHPEIKIEGFNINCK